MSVIKAIVCTLIGWCMCCWLVSCQQLTEQEREEVEHLIHRSFNMRYTHPDSMAHYARLALAKATNYPSGQAEAYNNLAFAALMQQHFLQAENYYRQSLESSNNQLEHLISHVGMMRICQRTASNKQFYDYYNIASRSIAHLQEEIDVLDEHDKARLALAISDFHLAASTYFYYMQQDAKAQNELLQLDLPAIAQSDSIQWVYGTYITAVSGLYKTNNPETTVTNEFDHLLQALYFSKQKGTVYLEANIIQTFSELLSDTTWHQVVQEQRHSELAFLSSQEVADSLLPTQLSMDALSLFEQYGDHYQIAGARRSLASLLFQRGKYAASLACLEEALDDINAYLKTCNPDRYDDFQLRPYAEHDSLSVEIRLLDEFPLYLVPQWLANIRESFSLAYSALGDKAASDYNRNIYLDILERTRQDKEWESRYEELQNESDATSWLLFLVVCLAVVGMVGFFYLNKLWRRRNAQAVSRLEQVATLCRTIVSKQGQLTADEQQRLDLLVQEDASLERLIQPYQRWSEEYATTLNNLEEEHEQLEKERYIHEQHVSDYKRQNLEKRTCMSIVNGITPFLDRILNEVERLGVQEQPEAQTERLNYICELVERINEYNDILALWIKMKQGQLSLHVENFQLSELFETISKGRRAFEQKDLQLQVMPTAACVKADKALTLFMINTLAENARKYTPAGGSVTVSAQEADDYVEIAVEDTGIGLSEADVKRILEEKVYDSSLVGMQHAEHQEVLQKNKGFGFGLMNCKGIIDKYRKTNRLFQVCKFGVESTLGKGSRFSVRLPKGVMRYCILIGLLLAGLPTRASSTAYMQQAEQWADSTYYSNVDGQYEKALVYADSAFYYVNRYIQDTAPNAPLISLHTGELAEVQWWNDGVSVDYHVILDIRNEVAVAALATCRWPLYQINNAGYTSLYKLLSEDTSLEAFCLSMQQSSSTQKLIIWFIIILIGVIVLAYYLLYFRNALSYRLGLEQTLRANEKILHLSGSQEVQQMLCAIYPDLCDIHPIQGLALLVNDGATHYPVVATDNQLLTPLLDSQLQRVCTDGHALTDSDSNTYIVPLGVELDDRFYRVGSLALIEPSGHYSTQERLLNDLVVRYIAIMIYNMLFHLANKQEDLELAEDEKRRAMHEENLLHVQNMMLDNCLSALKHETMYYPNRIRQMVEHMHGGVEKQQVHDMQELMNYYKEVFTLLSSCASRQLVTLRLNREVVPVSDLEQHVKQYFRKRMHKIGGEATLLTQGIDAAVQGDRHLLLCLMECVVDAALQTSPLQQVEFRWETVLESDSVRFVWHDPRPACTQEELNELFYPSMKQTAEGSGVLQCIPYLTIRQIIRDHEELNNHRGCRVNAQVAETGMQLWFTLPVKKTTRTDKNNQIWRNLKSSL